MRTRMQYLLVAGALTSVVAFTTVDSAPPSRADELHPAGSAAQGGGQGSNSSSTQGSWDAVTLGRVEPRAGEIKIAAPTPRLPTTVKSRGTWIGRLSASPGTATKAETAGMPSV